MTLTPCVLLRLVGDMLSWGSRDGVRVHPSLASNGCPLISHVLVVTLNLDVVIQAMNEPLVVIVRGLAPLELSVLTVIMLDVINKQTLGLSQILHKLFTENILSIGI